jgi:hypothetical protein
MAVNDMSVSEIRAMMQALSTRLDSLTQEQPSSRIRMLINFQEPEGDGKMGMSDAQVGYGEEPAPAAAAPAPAAAAPAPAPVPAPVPAPISYTSGTKLRWEIDENNRRVAIALKEGGILQVKVVENGSHAWTTDPRVKQKFASYAEWAASLPAGGKVSTEERDTRTSVEKKLATNMEGLTDAQKVRKLLSTWWIRGGVEEELSPLQKMTDFMLWVRQHRRDLAAITEDEDIANPAMRRRLTSKLRNLARKLVLQRQIVSTMTEEQKNTRHAWVRQWGTGKLFALLGTELHMITERDGKILFRNRWANTFEEHGIRMAANGKPALVVRYRRQMHQL